jgi:hypothetical protein
MIGVSTGAKFDVELPNTKTLTIGVDLQVWQMFERTEWKDPKSLVDEFPDEAKTALTGAPMSEAAGLQTNNPGYPGYKAGGTSVCAGASVSYNF